VVFGVGMTFGFIRTTFVLLRGVFSLQEGEVQSFSGREIEDPGLSGMEWEHLSPIGSPARRTGKGGQVIAG